MWESFLERRPWQFLYSDSWVSVKRLRKHQNSSSLRRSRPISATLRWPTLGFATESLYNRARVMARPAGQIVQRGARLWLVRIFLGRDPSTGKRKYPTRACAAQRKTRSSYLTAALRERDLGKPKLKAKTYRDHETLLKRYVRPS